MRQPNASTHWSSAHPAVPQGVGCPQERQFLAEPLPPASEESPSCVLGNQTFPRGTHSTSSPPDPLAFVE